MAKSDFNTLKIGGGKYNQNHTQHNPADADRKGSAGNSQVGNWELKGLQRRREALCIKHTDRLTQLYL